MKKFMFLVGSVVATLAMTTGVLAAARGDVDNDGILTANDAAAILQYSLNSSTAFPNPVYMDRGEIDADGNITANDAALVLQAVLSSKSLGDMPEDTDTYLDITLPSGTTVSTLFEFEDTDKVIDAVDSMVNDGKFDTAISSRIAAINSRIDNFSMTTKAGNKYTLKQAATWTKLQPILAPVLADTAAYESIATSFQNPVVTLDDLKSIYNNAKLAFPASSMTDANVTAALVNFTNSSMAQGGVSVVAEDGTTYTDNALSAYLFSKGFNNYDTVTIGDLKAAFGNSATITFNQTSVTLTLAER